MRVVFIAGPFRGKTAWDVERNIRRAEEVAMRVAELGAMPLCPHTNTRFFDGTLTDDFWLEGTQDLLSRCDAVVLVKNWQLSSGTKTEISLAEYLGIPVFDMDVEENAFARWLKETE